MIAESTRIDELKRRVEADPASVSFAALAEEYRRAKRFDDAIATCLAGLVHHPGYASARVTLGRALMEAGKPDEAQAEFEQVVRAAPENLAAIRALATLHERKGDRSEPAGGAPVPPAAVSAPAAPDAQQPAAAPDPALPGLEGFLSAIHQIRRETRKPPPTAGS